MPHFTDAELLIYWVFRFMSQKIYLGLAQWHHRKWYPNSASSSQSLPRYSHSFSSVEGNSSFYALPSENNLRLWDEITPDHFKFCFKFPKEISHKQSLTYCSRQVSEFLNRICVLSEKLGIIWLQLDPGFGASNLSLLNHFLRQLPTEFSYAVEVRNLDFFRKDEIEKQFNQLLFSYNINRVIFDTRSLFANAANPDRATLQALKAKPKVPTHVLHTSDQPFVRIIVPMNRELAQKQIEQWVAKAAVWIEGGLTPYMFFHTPDNVLAPEFARYFSQLLALKCPEIALIQLWDRDQKQAVLF